MSLSHLLSFLGKTSVYPPPALRLILQCSVLSTLKSKFCIQASMEASRPTVNITKTQNIKGKMKVRDLMVDKRRLVEVPYTATLAHTLNALVANSVTVVAVAAPPGKWIGAGGSMILESDKQTGLARKHYIGMVTMLDILAHLAGDDDSGGGVLDIDERMAVPVSSIIGHFIESLSLFTLSPNTGIMECMEVFSKGIHRALVPVDSQIDQEVSGVELAEFASSYRMLTQMDVLRFLKDCRARGHGGSEVTTLTVATELEGVMSQSVGELGAVREDVYAVSNRTRAMEAIKCMRSGSLNAVPIVEASDAIDEDYSQLINGRGRKLIGTFSATDLRGCPIGELQSWLALSVLDFTERVAGTTARELVTCQLFQPSLAEVMEKAVNRHVHRVWVVDEFGMLQGLVSLTDIIRVIRLSILSK